MALATVLTLAGSDPSGGAGIQADSKTIHALGGYALGVATALTAQNAQGVQAVFAVEPLIFAAQVNALLADYHIDALKIGMLADADKVLQSADILTKLPLKTACVLDPVLVSSSGKILLAQDAIQHLLHHLIPKVTLLTPNLPEAQLLLEHCGVHVDLNHLLTKQQFSTIRDALAHLHCANILLKGGHSTEDMAVDYLFSDFHKHPQIHSFAQPRITSQHNHGTGCTLSSAIACKLAQGETLHEAVSQAKDYLQQALLHSSAGQPHYLPLKTKSHRNGGLHHFLTPLT
ncbi:hydroxymethylpyrimidine/phosphomethylpyrimidine kinase [Thiosulfatimonas sediminis]|uniref:hydroxymethylpyrimidine kinase n=1 Tax=Thiosulfatimonas sediminis TaxID=2675054 RepID=A0A6F8PRM2_9GAMM|nr:bifunctional hydroxymethylpyrimidine kinase/phosphomethylpyrimidine kinase [Thiosulfatimonas sediminis]BBP44765.1 hydroxymethylpyrimidine/phosphomethylpyrimidine kinase [Thiosulfatimonas sediminis]